MNSQPTVSQRDEDLSKNQYISGGPELTKRINRRVVHASHVQRGMKGKEKEDIDFLAVKTSRESTTSLLECLFH